MDGGAQLTSISQISATLECALGLIDDDAAPDDLQRAAEAAHAPQRQGAANRDEVQDTHRTPHTHKAAQAQPAPEVQILASFTVNGGLAGETGARPIIAIYERGRNVTSSDVVYWGYYVRYTPESATNYVQAINV